MSKSVTHEEVEDVLSSIRRLVSEDKRPLAELRSADNGSVPQTSAQTSDQTSEGALPDGATPVTDRLVLTPALRVTPAAQTDAQAAPSGTAQDEAAGHPEDPAAGSAGPLDLGSVAHVTWHPGTTAQFRTSVAADRQALASGQTGSVPPHADGAVAPPSVRDAKFAEGSEAEQGAACAAPDVPLHSADQAAGSARPGADLMAGKVVPLTVKIAALEAAVSEVVQEWEPDGDEADDLAGLVTPAMAWEDDVELDARGAPLTRGPAEEAPMMEDAVEPVEEVADFHAAQAAPERPAQDAASHASASSETAAGDAVGDTRPERNTPSGSVLNADDQLMDEEALRDLVSEIVRAELQGALGERITRNVRKLVRREIHRALTAQEME